MESNFDVNENKYKEIYKKKGYTSDYILHQNKLIDVSNSKEFKPNEVYVIARYLFEGIKNPGDTSVLYILKTINGSKGTFIQRNNLKEDRDLVANFFDDIPEENISKKDNLL
ncbi:hypothetical protein D1818_20285 [Aquimarina sp. BL5]|uniref:hypothetical protein n=1 Tax=Aquimarina sp. BL5 TaxID=1714860 RepID=UPI000E4C7B6C|nr:hypothetical protein [Aquimarina sp. BL5]AXT53048.1 hypothetical protein D1818_20285 [Aquimarina sp. BL5]RKM98552.1 hypothetical protein D7036_19995 [Aquimarina sp. BL5]